MAFVILQLLLVFGFVLVKGENSTNCSNYVDYILDCANDSYLCAPVPAHEYILDFPTDDNHLNISFDNETKSNNYFITIGDWGASWEPLLDDYSVVSIVANIFFGASYECDEKSQRKVGDRIIEFVNNQEAKGKTLLFFVLVGDNFYWRGNNGTQEAWSRQWVDVYGYKNTSNGKNLTSDYYWFPTMGNHDWLSSDYTAMCPWRNTRVNVSKVSKNGTIVNMPYAGNQLVQSKGGTAPEKYYMPDYSYYYTINDLNLELIMLETNGLHCCADELYDEWNDVDFGAASYENCCESFVCRCTLYDRAQTWLRKLSTASHEMLIERAKNSSNTNFILANHYPKEGSAWLEEFNGNRSNASLDIVVSVFGHTHNQDCYGYATDPWNNTYCNKVLTGGGGGCCDVILNADPSNGQTRGFYVLGFAEYNITYDDDNSTETHVALREPYDVTNSKVSSYFDCGEEWNNTDAFDYGAYCLPGGIVNVSSTFGTCVGVNCTIAQFLFNSLEFNINCTLPPNFFPTPTPTIAPTAPNATDSDESESDSDVGLRLLITNVLSLSILLQLFFVLIAP